MFSLSECGDCFNRVPVFRMAFKEVNVIKQKLSSERRHFGLEIHIQDTLLIDDNKSSAMKHRVKRMQLFAHISMFPIAVLAMQQKRINSWIVHNKIKRNANSI